MLPKKNTFKIAVLASLLSILIAIVMLTILLGTYGESIQNYLNSNIPNSFQGAVTFVAILTLAMAIGLPRQITALSGGYLFGVSYGMLLATISAIFGCIITLILARKLFSNLVQQHYPKQLIRVQSFFAHQTFLKAVIIRLIPAGSNFLTNILAGSARAPTAAYICGSALGFIPQMAIFTLMGAGLKVSNQQQIIFSIILLTIAIILSAYLYKNTRLKLPLN